LISRASKSNPTRPSISGQSNAIRARMIVWRLVPCCFASADTLAPPGAPRAAYQLDNAGVVSL
jgi:hypothetical protein